MVLAAKGKQEFKSCHGCGGRDHLREHGRLAGSSVEQKGLAKPMAKLLEGGEQLL